MPRCEYIYPDGTRCDINFKTGRKYCYKHRHGASDEDKLLNKAEKRYWQITAMKYYVVGYVLLLLIAIAVVSINPRLYFNAFMVFLLVAVIIIYIPLALKNRIIRSEKCEEYVSNYLRKHKEERDRRDRIKDEALR